MIEMNLFAGGPINSPPVNQLNNYNMNSFYNNSVNRRDMMQQSYQPQNVNQQMQQPFTIKSLDRPVEDKIVVVPGLNSQQPMFNSDLEDVCKELQAQFNVEFMEAEINRQKSLQGNFVNNPYGYATNYYGNQFNQNCNFTTPYNVVNKYRAKIDDIRNSAMKQRREFNKHLARLAANYCGIERSEEELNEIYDGFTYVIPKKEIEQIKTQDDFSKYKPFDNSDYYRKQYASVSKKYQDVFNEYDQDLNGFLEAQGYLYTLNRMEEERHRRKNKQIDFNTSAYQEFLMNSIRSRNNNSNTTQTKAEEVIKQLEEALDQAKDPNSNLDQIINNLMTTKQELANCFPTLTNGNHIMEDGTNVITMAPPPPELFDNPELRQTRIQLQNELRQSYDENVSKFLNSIYEAANNG